MLKKTLAALVVAAIACMAPAAAYAADGALTTSAVSDAEAYVEYCGSAGDLKGMIDGVAPDASEENPITVKLTAEGNPYVIGSQIKIPANVTLDLNGQTVKSSVNYVFALNGDGATVTNGRIEGSGVRVNANDPRGAFSKLAIDSAPEYALYIPAAGTIGSIADNTVTKPNEIGINVQSGHVAGDISGNTIEGCKGSDTASLYLYKGAKVDGNISGNTIKNGTCYGIWLFSKASCGNIENNTIAGCGDHAIRLIGSKNASTNDGSWCGDIVNNTIADCKGHGISLYHGSHAGKITGNTLTNIGGKNNGGAGDYGITVNSGCKYKSYAAEITGNKLTNVAYASIVVFAGPEGDTTGKWQDNAYVEGDIANNIVTNSGTYKKGVNWAKKAKVACQGAIYVDSHARVFGSIHHNTVNTSYDNGINVLAYSSVKSIYSNTIKNASNAGIAVANNSTVSAGIYSNKIASPKIYGLFINNGSKVKGKIQKNTITSAGTDGIYVGKKATAATVTKNTVKKAGLYGIIAASGGKITTVSSNKVNVNNAKAGIAIIANLSSPIKTIKGNTITGKYSCGIRVNTPGIKVSVASNKLTTSSPKSKRSVGISVNGCKKKAITISSNKITGNNTAVAIQVKTSVAKLKKNTFKKSTKLYSCDWAYKLTA